MDPRTNGFAPPNFEAFVQEARKANESDRKRADLFEGLLRTEAWRAYVKLLNALIEEQAAGTLNAAGSIEGVLQGEHKKGVVYGMIFARDLLDGIVAHNQASNPAEETKDV